MMSQVKYSLQWQRRTSDDEYWNVMAETECKKKAMDWLLKEAGEDRALRHRVLKATSEVVLYIPADGDLT